MVKLKKFDDITIGVIGLGYVGLPLAIELAKVFKLKGYDSNSERITQLKSNIDNTGEVDERELEITKSQFTDMAGDLSDCDVYIVTVPTPIDSNKSPDLRPLESASELLGGLVSKGNIVIFESTVYPGATEEVCIPIIENVSGLQYNQEFFAGYSPERINPGDKTRKLKDIKKVTSGSNQEVAYFVDKLYAQIIEAGTHMASSIKVAEASKVIENTQRDLNIALINELSIIFNLLDIDTQEVLEAAGTKWNFLPFRPGLVGGHCIGVDPYYLTHKSKSVGFLPDVIMAGRKINDGMGKYVASRLIKKMLQSSIEVVNSKVLILGFTFKENCPDTRNTKVVDVVNELNDYGVQVDVFDPYTSETNSETNHCCRFTPKIPEPGIYDAVVIAVAHDIFKDLSRINIRGLCKPKGIVYDLKYLLPKDVSDLRF